MSLKSTPRPFSASFLAAAVACWPILFAAARELLRTYGAVERADWGDDLFIGFNLLPFIYPLVVISCFTSGQCLVVAGCTSLRAFIVTSSVVALLITLFFFAGQVSAFHLSWKTGMIEFSKIFSVLFLSFVPAACCWWYFAASRHNMQLNPDGSAAG
jgi:hypothetical protein